MLWANLKGKEFLLEFLLILKTKSKGMEPQAVWISLLTHLKNLFTGTEIPSENLDHVYKNSLVDEGKTMDVVQLGMNKAFDTVSHSILLEKMAVYSLNRYSLHWVENQPEG